MTATPSAPCSPDADRFRCQVDVPDPPPSPKGRLRYWADTVQEAVAELRRQLRSHDPDRADRALFAIIDVEKTRMRHGRPVSGTHVPCLPDLDDDWGNLIVTAPEKVADPGLAAGDEEPDTPAVAGRQAGETSPPEPAPDPNPTTPVVARSASERRPLAERATTPDLPTPLQSWLGRDAAFVPGVTAAFSDRDDDYTREPGYVRPADWQPYDENARYDAVIDRQRVAFIESYGLYPEDEYPNNPDYARFRSEPRPHPAELRWMEWRFGLPAPPPDGAERNVPSPLPPAGELQ